MTGRAKWRPGLVVACLLAGCGGWGVDAPPGRGAAAPIPPASPPNGIAVEPGDTVYSISQRYGVPVRTIIDENGLRPPFRLRVDRRLTLPQPRHHVVETGDTISAIAKRHGVERSTLVRTNRIARPSRAIEAGRFLRLPTPPAVVAVEQVAIPPAMRDEPPAASAATREDPPSTTVMLAPPPVPAPSPAATNDADAGAAPSAQDPVPSRSMSGRAFLWPVRGRVISEFGVKEDGLHNDGINIAAPRGSFVRAAENGVVAYAGNEMSGFGNLLLIKHAGGWTTAYAHNEVLLVERGNRVRRGQAIARIGSTGSIRQPQLHFEIRQGRAPVDPRAHMDRASRAGDNFTAFKDN